MSLKFTENIINICFHNSEFRKRKHDQGCRYEKEVQ